MKKLFAATLLASTIAGVSFAGAMTAAPSTSPLGTEIIQVAGGCGPGFHRGPYGRCIGNRGIVHRPAVRKCRFWGPGRRVCRTWW